MQPERPKSDRTGTRAATRRRNVCFVTGTRAELGLMQRTLKAIAKHPRLKLQTIVTGMHLDRTRGLSARQLAAMGVKIDAVVPWRTGNDPSEVAVSTGRAIAHLAQHFAKLKTDIVLIVGDRVEAMAAAIGANISQRLLAHVHGGDRAQGQVDDALRHAITKLAHVHFPATDDSAKRIVRLGEVRKSIHVVGSPGVEGIIDDASPWRAARKAVGGIDAKQYALLLLHPTDPDDSTEERRAEMLLQIVRAVGIKHSVIIYPNNDPGSAGIVRAWERHAHDRDVTVVRDLPRPLFLSLLRNAAMLIGNSSAGILEAGALGTPAVDIGDRQAGRQRGANVLHAQFTRAAITSTIRRIIRIGSSAQNSKNPYRPHPTSKQIADVLSRTPIDEKILHKLIAY